MAAGDAPVPLSRPSVGAAELRAVAEVLESGWLAGQGPQGTLLEEGFARLTGRRHAIAVSNCTAGLHLVLRALGVGPGDEVVVADYSFPATAHAVLFCGGVPRFADVRADTGTVDPEAARRLITPRTRGIIGVDALGVPADWNELGALAEEHGLFLVEDAACSSGGSYREQPCGAFGNAAVFSLHARKGITSGEGGVIVTDDDELAERARSWSAFGMRSAFERQSTSGIELPTFAEVGYNYKLSDVLAAIARVQLDRLAELTAARTRLADRYATLLDDLPRISAPVVPADRRSTWQTYAVTVGVAADRDRLVSGLRDRGIGANIGTYALHTLPVYASTDHCPRSDDLFRRHLALPMYPGLTEAEQDRVASTLGSLIASS